MATGNARVHSLVKRPRLLTCRVVITMPDQSKGEHVGLYRHSIDALVRAMDLFPQASKISVCAGRAVP